jgi:hypothetical protein
MKIEYNSIHAKAQTVIKQSQKIVNPLIDTMEKLRIKNTEIKELDVALQEEERVIKQKRAELAAQELANTQLINGLSKLFSVEEPTFEEVVNSTVAEDDDLHYGEVSQ